MALLNRVDTRTTGTAEAAGSGAHPLGYFVATLTQRGSVAERP
jgi:hypothetical protein